MSIARPPDLAKRFCAKEFSRIESVLQPSNRQMALLGRCF